MLKRSKADIPLGTETIDVDQEEEAINHTKNRLSPADVISKAKSYLEGKSCEEKRWRSEILQICIRINGKEYWEAYNRLMELDLNLMLYLIKFLKMEPEMAAKKVDLNEYALYCKDS